MQLEEIYRLFLQCNGITTDSRNCPAGSMFIALKGPSFNGNQFAQEAIRKGCNYAIIDESLPQTFGSDQYILVKDCLDTLQQLARLHRIQMGIPVLAITGTNGKTTTKELIANVLKQRYQIIYTEGNLNNHIGVPLTLLRIRPQHELAVIEMGASHPDEIAQLCQIALPDYGLITNIGKAHLEGFGSLDGVIKAKGELYNYLQNKPNTCIFIHTDDPYLPNMSHGMKALTYGTDKTNDIQGKAYAGSTYLTFQWASSDEKKEHTVQTNLIGNYNLPNVLAAITVGKFFKIDETSINQAIEHYTPKNNRSQLQNTQYNTLIIDAYNANPTSMIVALQNFAQMEVPHKMVLLGDMLELGKESIAEHLKIINYLSTSPFEKIWLVGDIFNNISCPYTTFPNIQEVIKTISQEQIKNYTILIKGSNGIRLTNVIPYL